MYNNQSELLTPHESIITQETPGCEFTYHLDLAALTNPSFTDLDFQLQNDITSSNYLSCNTDPSDRLGVPMQQDFPYQLSGLYGAIPSENSSFMPGLMEGYTVGQFESPKVGGKRKRGGGQNCGFNGVVEKKEKQRRERLSEKFEMLKNIIPNRTKDDRATIVADGIEYIHELCRTVNELKLLVEKKRLQNPDMMTGDMQSSDVMLPSIALDGNGDQQEGLNNKGPKLRSSWLQRKSKEAFVDVRIIEDEVNIKITKKKKTVGVGCLLPVSKAVDELHLRLLHLSGGVIGECHVYMLNTQVMEGSSVYASAVAKKLIEVIDMQ
ncbi:hypothetical protein LUZ60_003449 [Juncus effusus]|nr:hypothetical protein LUZ60_003449 [Juncus effusus]